MKIHATPVESFRYAARGFITALLAERNLYIAWWAFLGVVLASVYFRLSGGVLLAVLICCTIAIATELLNTAIETLVDLVSPEWNVLAGQTKDIAAGAEWFTALMAGAVGLIVFVPRLSRIAELFPRVWNTRAYALLGLLIAVLALGFLPGYFKIKRRRASESGVDDG